MTNKERDEKYEVVWSGGEGLVQERLTKPSEIWQPSKPTRLYNKKAAFWAKLKGIREEKLAKNRAKGKGQGGPTGEGGGSPSVG